MLPPQTFGLCIAAISCLAAPLLLRAAEPPAVVPERCYLFSSFRGNGEDGLHLAWSTDALKWTALNGDRSFLKPTVGKEKLMRDPCPLLGPDGVFHMVWTDSWTDRTIGYASSKDLINWTPQKTIPVMKDEPAARNCWAPEVVYDESKKHYLIFWATTIPGKFPLTERTAERDYNHRIYCTTTSDFETFTPTRLFYDGGFNAIDATMLRDGEKVLMVVKDETLKPVKKHLRLVTGASFEGPWTSLSEPFTNAWVEGPAFVKINGEYRVYYDRYREHGYGAVRSTDLVHWENITDVISFPRGSRHGTIFEVPGEIVRGLLAVDTASAAASTTQPARE